MGKPFKAFVFPGQGAQTVGMGAALAAAFPSARAVFSEVDDALDQHLTKLIWTGPQEALTLTENAQPALMAMSLAVLRVLEQEGGVRLDQTACFVAGHSLGEYSALAAARSLGIAEAARLLRRRGQAMQQAVPAGQGTMAALLGLDLAIVQEIVQEARMIGICDVANDNANGQVVVSGTVAAVDQAVSLAKQRGSKRSVMLDVSAPFHCSLMQPASEAMAQELMEYTFPAPNPPLIANVTASIATESDQIRRLLIKQVTETVRWRESVLTMRDAGCTALIELGAGRVLSGLTRRIDRDLHSQSLSTPKEIEAFLR